MKTIDNICQSLKKNGLTKEQIFSFFAHGDEVFADESEAFETLVAYGLPLRFENGLATLSTIYTPIAKQNFCFVDIETNGSKPSVSQVIEIAAIRWIDGKIAASFEELVHCEYIPTNIQEITHISPADLVKAKSEKVVLRAFKEFLGDSVFVAHNVNFDFQFLSVSCKRNYLGSLANRRLCTIELAKRTLQSERYGLRYLTQRLGFEDIGHHRAFCDTLNSLKIFEECLKHLPEEVKTVEQLIDFSKVPIVIDNKTKE